MKKSVIAAVSFAVFVLTDAADAADLTARFYGAPLPPPVWTWTGFYVGGNFGGGFGDKWWTNNTTCGAECDFRNEFGFSGQSLGTTSMDGFLGGFQAGYNYQIGQWVFGVEGTWDWTNMRGQFPLATLTGVDEGSIASSNLEWIATVVGRGGITIDRALLYVGGGAAWTHEKDSVNFSSEVTNFNANGSETPFGWTFLAGVEYMIDPHWSARIQYNFYDFGSENGTLNFKRSVTQNEFGPAPISTQLRINSLVAGVNYRFWGF